MKRRSQVRVRAVAAKTLRRRGRGGGGRKNRDIRRGRRGREMVEGAGRMRGERRDEGGREGRREGDVRGRVVRVMRTEKRRKRRRGRDLEVETDSALTGEEVVIGNTLHVRKETIKNVTNREEMIESVTNREEMIESVTNREEMIESVTNREEMIESVKDQEEMIASVKDQEEGGEGGGREGKVMVGRVMTQKMRIDRDVWMEGNARERRVEGGTGRRGGRRGKNEGGIGIMIAEGRRRERGTGRGRGRRENGKGPVTAQETRRGTDDSLAILTILKLSIYALCMAVSFT